MTNVIDLYKDSFNRVKNHNIPKTFDDSLLLSETLEKVKENHRNLELDIYNSINDITIIFIYRL